MILYTTVPLEAVFAGGDRSGNMVELDLGSRWLLVEALPTGQARVIKLLSTDPADFLRPEWQPGQLINTILTQ